MNRFAIAVAISSVFVAASPALAQQPWAVELRGGVAFPTADLGEDELDTGLGFEGTIRYRFLPHLAAYAGWDWMHFGADEAGGVTDVDVEATGYAFGLRFEHPFSGGTGPGPAYWARAGVLVDHIEIENQEGDLIADTGHGLGWEVGAGVAIGVGEKGSLTPGVRYRSLSRDLEFDGGEVPVDLRYVAAELGFAWRL